MPIETGTVIENLDKLWPLSGDFLLEGDNHLRLIKAVLKNQFPGAGGLGFAKPITASEDELNYSVGLTSNIQTQIDNLIADVKAQLNAPAGTVMIFYQASPPLGWTQIQNNNGSMLQLANSAGGAGGTDNPVSLVWTHAHTTAAVALTLAQIPPHRHATTPRVGAAESGNGYNTGWNDTFGGLQNKFTDFQGSGQAHSHGNTGNASFSWAPKYINVMTASRNA